MFTKNEIIAIIISTIIIAFSANFLLHGAVAFLWTLLAIFIVILANIVAKKIAGYFLETDVEHKIWEVYWFGFKKHQHFKKPFPLGAFLPLISKLILLPLNGFVWMASLIFEVKPRVYRAARKHGLYNFSGMTESHIGIIAAAGIAVNLLLAIVGYLIGFTDFARFNIYYAFFNMLPISNLDGNKIFFGNITLWSFLATLVMMGIFLSLFII